YPWLQIAYLAISSWIVIYLIIDQPMESLWGILNLAIGTLTFFLNRLFFFRKYGSLMIRK
ncbi:MAG: hypothetical protein AAFO07_23615, partial [Bacteroidota bacterium]